ncbi:imidazolonepropionase [Govanella unica]|uniref:Imidazolonepropionase n=1 Tax=Govanella unica TaxID=2975056 RepID=A0A9X3TU71_9PROT|nr:imidazolonepropionase [Govania unica]MDA5192426.1 imidazolonepropionase [Govania unica]
MTDQTDQNWDRLWTNVNLATVTDNGAAYGAILQGALAVVDGRIAWVGTAAELECFEWTAREITDCGGRWMTPGLIDCHTHLVYGGDRAREFEMRLQGASYEEIARAGGGILSTVRATRAASAEDLLQSATERARRLVAEGVTTIEIKSGYGLDFASERKMLQVARALGRALPVEVRTTFLGAHAVPPDYVGDRAGYVRHVADDMLPGLAAEGLVDAVDAFCEGIGFSLDETRLIFERARALGLPVKLHAEQLSDLGGAGLAADFTALSADHLEFVSEPSLQCMSASGTVAVLLPGAFYFLHETRKPPVELMRRHGVAMAVATDCNPGTSPTTSLLLMMNMAAVLFGLTPEETLQGVTRNAARALGLGDRGMLAIGLRADLALWDITSPAMLSYMIGAQPPVEIWRA